jgi:hypothetical protein
MITPDSKKYGVKLLSYKGQALDLMVWSHHTIFSDNVQEAIIKRDEFADRNPDGVYEVVRIAD